MSGDLYQDKVAIDVLAEFVEVAIHSILYNRNLYPQGVFGKRVKYNVPLQMCLHPDVCSYIGSITESLKTLLSEGQVDKISVVILQEETNTPVERFVLEIGEIRQKWKETDPHLLHIEQSLRGFLLKLNLSDALLRPAAKGTTWTVHVHTQNSTLTAVEEKLMLKDFPWMQAEEKQQLLENAQIVPLRSMVSDMLSLQFYAEEGGCTT